MISFFAILLFLGGIWGLIWLSRESYLFRRRLIRYLVVAYPALLLLSVPLLYLAPEAKIDIDRQEAVIQMQESSSIFKQAIQQGQLPSDKEILGWRQVL